MESTTGPSDPSGAAGGLKGEITVQEPTRAERTIARRSAEARATVPDLELSTEVEVSSALALAEEIAGGHFSHRHIWTSVLVRACALVLRAHPLANAAYRDGHYELYSRVNVGVVLQTDEGFTTPTVLDADRKSLAQVSGELETLAFRAQAGELTPPELAGATCTLTDLSDFCVTRAGALLVPPHAVALAAGAVKRTPVVRNGAVVPGRVLSLTLACDGRILFGARAARVLDALTATLERAAV
jgi:pyruvate dehydrogenase E2 component (dihydrolipoamide acetyltransferase)